MRLGRFPVTAASVGLLAPPASRLGMLMISAAATMSCEPCSVGPISPDTLPDGQVGKAYFFQLRASYQGDCAVGSSGHVEFELLAGRLPPLMKLSKDGALDGSPFQSGTYSFTVVATMNVNVHYPPVESQPVTYTLTILP